MTARQWETAFEALTEIVSQQKGHIDLLTGRLHDADRLAVDLRVAISNIAGMALDHFPQLAQAYDRERDPYELIRQCFLALRSADKRTSDLNPHPASIQTPKKE